MSSEIITTVPVKTKEGEALAVNVQNQIARDSDGHAQVDVLTMPSISVSMDIQPHVLDSNQYTGTFAPTGAGSTTIISAVSGKTIKVFDVYLWNSGSSDVGVRLYFGTSGKNIFKGKLAPKTGVLKTFIRPWESNAGDSLVLYLDAAGTCDYGVGAVQS